MENSLCGASVYLSRNWQKLLCKRKQWKSLAQLLFFPMAPSLSGGPGGVLWQKYRTSGQAGVNLGPRRIAEVKIGLLEPLEGNDTEAGSGTKC